MATMVTIFANGKARQVRPSQTVAEMIREMGIEPSSVLVERNGGGTFTAGVGGKESGTRGSAGICSGGGGGINDGGGSGEQDR